MLRLYNNRADHATPFPGTGAVFLGRGFPWQKSPAVRARLGIWSRPYPPQTKLPAPVHAEKWCVPILLHKFTHPLSKKLWQNAHPNGKQKLTVPPNPVTIGSYGNPASVVGIAQRRGRMQNTVWLSCTDRRDLSAAARELLAHALAHWFMARMESPNWNRAGCGSAFRTPGARSPVRCRRSRSGWMWNRSAGRSGTGSGLQSGIIRRRSGPASTARNSSSRSGPARRRTSNGMGVGFLCRLGRSTPCPSRGFLPGS